ncbi:MAG TPA: hypothetical protein ACFYEK_09730 [Candidatus Wunengus sp. YC60]|uniref:hypothetical protein n=1 Tax=Candidatus Wunengus sp. YC60 TaxID=3367697 RepID=UPI004024CE02
MFWRQSKNTAVYRKSNRNKTAGDTRSHACPKTFLDTLVHEFMHHYDYEVLKFPTSLRTAGFYYRLGDVMKKLMG